MKGAAYILSLSPPDNGVFNQFDMSLWILTADPSNHCELPLQCKMIVHRNSRLGCKTDCSFFTESASRVHWLSDGIVLHPLPRTMDCFLAGGAWDDPVMRNLEHSSNACQAVGLAPSRWPRVAENVSNCPVLECMSLLACCKIEVQCPLLAGGCYGAQRQLCLVSPLQAVHPVTNILMRAAFYVQNSVIHSKCRLKV